MRRLCFGGSFNPIHHGHLICARAAAEKAGFNEVILIPAAVPPHKTTSSELAAASHRLEMCKLASSMESDLFFVDDIELARGERSFTLETVRALKQRGWKEVFWLVGADMLLDLPNWHRPQELVKEVNLVVVARPGWKIDWASLPPLSQSLRQSVIEAPLVDIRATDIRRRVAHGQSIAYLTPQPVVEYIQQQRLYV
jgi:nicotinate-nucleotide adenylyltransferase